MLIDENSLASLRQRAHEWVTQFHESVVIDVPQLELPNLDCINAAKLWQVLQESELPDRQALDPLIELAARFGLELILLHAVLLLAVVLIVVQKWQTQRMVLYYQPTAECFKQLIKLTDIMTMEYKPWIGTLNVHAQGFWFCMLEVWTDLCFSVGKRQCYEREILELSDGGEIALDWLIQDQKHFDSRRNIVVVVPGINGDSTKPYVTNLHRTCIASGYDLVVVNWRGMGGVPLKVSKS